MRRLSFETWGHELLHAFLSYESALGPLRCYQIFCSHDQGQSCMPPPCEDLHNDAINLSWFYTLQPYGWLAMQYEGDDTSSSYLLRNYCILLLIRVIPRIYSCPCGFIMPVRSESCSDVLVYKYGDVYWGRVRVLAVHSYALTLVNWELLHCAIFFSDRLGTWRDLTTPLLAGYGEGFVRPHSAS